MPASRVLSCILADVSEPVLEFQVRPGCLLVLVTGRDILERKAVTLQAIAAALKTHQRRAAMLDVRAVPGPITFMDRFQLGVLAGCYLAGIAVGVLARPDQADPQRIGQLVARNRGTEVQVFTDPIDAEAWLQARAAKA